MKITKDRGNNVYTFQTRLSHCNSTYTFKNMIKSLKRQGDKVTSILDVKQKPINTAIQTCALSEDVQPAILAI